MTTSHDSPFFVTLPCTSSFTYFPNNSPSQFKTKLAQSINLRGNWEVALAEIQYPASWFNVKRELNFFYGDSTTRKDVTIAPGYYHNVGNLLAVIHDKMAMAMRDHIKFKYNRYTNKVVFSLTEGTEILWIDKVLTRLLGIKPGRMVGPGLFKGDRVIPYEIGDPDLFVYTDIASPVLVGDAFVPLLRVVRPNPSEKTHRVTVAFDKMHYVPLRVTQFDSIEINISGDNGELIHFNFGNTTVKLHFRPRKLAYL